ncbi:MAG: SH3 domain-containing protein [Propionibacteriaceae bacterium]|jgi:uncharacterized protein YgiM (DUF1202 family)|nr:SH3 domain-containing protein [Propionibacteriaceae bacterium]
MYVENERHVSRLTVVWVLVAALAISGFGIGQAGLADAATKAFAATGDLNIRSGASTSSTILYTLKKGDIVLSNGSAKSGWQPIKFNGGTAYVYAQYTKSTSTTSPYYANAPAKMLTTANVNLRASASLKGKIVKVLQKGVEVQTTGRVDGKFTEATVDGSARWLYTQYLGTPIESSGSTPPASNAITNETIPTVAATAVTTAALTLRADSSSTSADLGLVPQGATIGLTGAHIYQYSQAVYGNAVGWVLTGYYTDPTATFAFPVAKAKKYVNATDVNLRAGSSTSSELIGKLAFATLLVSTGVEENGYTQVIYSGALRWVYTQYLNSSEPSTAGDLGSTSLNKLEKYGKAAVIAVRQAFPEIKTIYGWRSSSAYSSDHPNGRAIDIMIPDYKNNKALGTKIANWVIANAKDLHVTYLIWYQRNYRISRGSWVKMADRGSDNQNHKNHVHVSFSPS